MKYIQKYLPWVLVFSTIGAFAWYYQSCFPDDPPGWRAFHDAVKSGNSPEEVMQFHHVDTDSQMEPPN